MANLYYFALFLCISSEALAQRTPTISHITQEQIRDIGGQVDLQCSVHYSQDFPVIWVKYDQSKSVESIPLSNNANLIIKDSRFSLRFDEATATYTLSIKDIQENDAGWYQCQVLISISNKIAAEVELQVRRPPIVSDNSTRSVVASEGESVQMECYAGGFPVPKISWRRENNAILPTGGSIYRGNILRITSVHKEDRGTYYCVAENGVGKGARRNINLEVEFAPVVQVPKPRLAQVEFAPVVQVPKPRLAQWQILWQKKDTITGQRDDTIKEETNSDILLQKLDASSLDVGETSSMRHSILNEAHLKTNKQVGEDIIHQYTENYPAFNPTQCSKREKKLRLELLLKEHLKRMSILDEEKEIKLMILNEQLKFVKEENEIKKKIIEEQQREAKYKADLAHMMLYRNP